MALFEKALEATVMSTHLLIRADVSKEVLKEAYRIAKDFEKRYSAYKEDSFLSEINTKAHLQPLPCTAVDLQLFQRAHDASVVTKGTFDITIGSLSHGCYHFGFVNQSIPKEAQLQKEKALVDYRSVVLQDNTIFLKERGTRLDLGGIGKGFCANLIVQFLLDQGAKKLLVDVGGEIVTVGKSYTVAIKDPFKEGNIAYIKTTKEATSLSTSGNYERYIGSTKTHHIINPDSARSKNFYSSMSVIKNGFDIDLLDAYATALFNQNPSEVQQFSKKEKITTILIDQDGSVIINNLEASRIQKLEFA